MKPNIKMIGLDLDGTLLSSQKEFTKYSQSVLARAIRRGIEVLPVTGRPLTAIPEEVLHFPGVRYAVTANGARVVDVRENRVLLEQLVSAETARKILEVFEHYDTLREIYYDGVGYAEKDALDRIEHYLGTPPMARYLLSTRVPIADVRAKFEEENRAVDKMQAIFARQDERKQALTELAQIPKIEVTGALSNNIEVNAGGVNKGSALVHLGEMLRIKREEILAFGDGANDCQMMKEAGMSIAMANGEAEVKEAADYITGSNDEEGVAKAIEQYVLS